MVTQSDRFTIRGDDIIVLHRIINGETDGGRDAAGISGRNRPRALPRKRTDRLDVVIGVVEHPPKSKNRLF